LQNRLRALSVCPGHDIDGPDTADTSDANKVDGRHPLNRNGLVVFHDCPEPEGTMQERAAPSRYNKPEKAQTSDKEIDFPTQSGLLAKARGSFGQTSSPRSKLFAARFNQPFQGARDCTPNTAGQKPPNMRAQAALHNMALFDWVHQATSNGLQGTHWSSVIRVFSGRSPPGAAGIPLRNCREQPRRINGTCELGSWAGEPGSLLFAFATPRVPVGAT